MIFITGATAGIGEACAIAFAAQKKDLFLTGRRVDRLAALKARLEKEHSVRVLTEVLDVTDRDGWKHLEKKHAAALEQVDTCIVNAGLALGLDPVQDATAEDWDQMIETNIKGALWTTQSLLPFFKKKNRGQFIFLGSVAARWMYARGNVYSATKAALHAFAESMRLDLLGSKIRVSVLAPGMVETEFSEVRFKGDRNRAEAVYRGIEALTPMDIAEAAVWVASRPERVNIQEVVMYPTAQASTSQVFRVPAERQS